MTTPKKRTIQAVYNHRGAGSVTVKAYERASGALIGDYYLYLPSISGLAPRSSVPLSIGFDALDFPNIKTGHDVSLVVEPPLDYEPFDEPPFLS